MAIENNYNKLGINVTPVDANGNQILAARRWRTTSVTLVPGVKTLIKSPPGSYEVVIKGANDVTFYETANSEVIDCYGTNVTFGTGYTGTNFNVPVCDNPDYWLEGNGLVQLAYACIDIER